MEDVFERLRQKLDLMTKGYPKTDEGYELAFLKKIFNEEDANFFINFKLEPQTPEQVAADLGMSVEEAREKLEEMSDKHLMFWERDGSGNKKYRIIPFIHGLWEYNVDLIDKADALNMGKYYANGFGKTILDYRLPIARVVPIRPDVVKDNKLLPDDDVEAIVKGQTLIVASDCACRKVASFGKNPCQCTEDTNVCIVFGSAAEFILETNMGHPRIITTEETLAMLRDDEIEGRFVQLAHSKQNSGFCSCPRCHCGILMGAKVSRGTGFDTWHNYTCTKDQERCTNCLKCVERCPMKAMTAADDDTAVFQRERCFGCGLCVTTCPTEALILERKPDDQLILPQDDSFFDNQARMGRERIEIDKQRLAASEGLKNGAIDIA